MTTRPKTRRGVHAGTVAERPHKGSGTWHAFLPKSMTDGQRVRIPGYWKSEREARAALNDYVADLRHQRRHVPARGTTEPQRVADAVLAYIEYRTTAPKGRWAARTEEGYRAVLANCVQHPAANVGDLVIDRVSPPVINRWYEDLANAGVPDSRIRYARWLLSGTLKWLITRGDYVGANPVGQVASFWSKTDTDDATTTRPVLLPTWSELAGLIRHPTAHQDRLLIALLAWAGLRWTEAISLRTTDVWPDRPMITVARVLVWKQAARPSERVGGPKESPGAAGGQWIEEPVKGGQRATVPLPTPLWQALARLAETRATEPLCPEPATNLLFRGPRWQQSPGRTGIINNRNWTRDIWVPARTSVGLVGDKARPDLDPRRNAILIKDLRAFTASILHDSGATDLEASAMLRHRDTRTTERYYARAISEKAHDPDRAKLRLRTDLSLSGRIEALWDIWARKYPEATASIVR